MKKLLVLMLTIITILSFAACGGGASDTESEFTAEQQAFAQEFADMTDAFNEIVDRVNESPEILSDEELVNTMNELSNEISAADEYFTSPETLTPEIMDGLKPAMELTHQFIDLVGTALDEIDSAQQQ